jgi:hypothetical protein
MRRGRGANSLPRSTGMCSSASDQPIWWCAGVMS